MNNDHFDPAKNEFAPAPTVRHRRSDRHRGASEAASAPASSPARREAEAPAPKAAPSPAPLYDGEEASRQWVRQQPPVISPAPEEPEYQPPQPQRVLSSRDQRYMRPMQEELLSEKDAEEDDEYEGGGFPWLKVLLAAVLVLAVLCGALYFIKDAGPLTPVGDKLRSLIGGQKEAGKVISFQTTASSGLTESRLEFHVTTNQAVDGVRLEDQDGNEVVCKASMVSGEKDVNRIWSITAVFDEPFSGDLYAAIREGDTWRRTDSSVQLIITAPTPAPTPAPTQAPVVTQAPMVTQMPAVAATIQPLNATPAPTPAPTAAPTAEPTAQPTETPAPAAAPMAEEGQPEEKWFEDDLPEDGEDGDLPDKVLPDGEGPEATAQPLPVEAAVVPAGTWAPTAAPASDWLEVPDEPEDETAPVPTQAPTPEPTAEPTPEPTAEPTPEPTFAPSPTPLPRLEAVAASAYKGTDTVYGEKGKAIKNYSRERSYVAPNPDQYSRFDTGLFTFRGDNFRRNAAFGTADIRKESMTVIWKAEIGSLRTADSGTLYGVGWTGQPAIVKWTKEVREMMNLNEEKKNTTGLREVIFGAQDGKIYFLDIKDGTPTRDPIVVGYPLKGSVSVDAMGRPLLAVGQGISKLSNKTGDIGMHVYNLVDGKKAFFLNGKKNSPYPVYTANGAFDGTALFLYENDAMIAAGENGLLYAVDLNSQFSYPNVNDPEAKGALTLSRSITALRTKATGEKDNRVGVEASVAMYDKYVYMADTYGVVRCVDTDTMQTVWAFDNGDNTDVLALDMEGDTGVSLYTGNTAYARLTSKKDVSIRKLNALTGEEIWKYDLKCAYDKEQMSGCKASPVVGQHSISDLVIYTVNKVDGGGSRMLALDKATGKVVWQKNLAVETVSSPVAVYNEKGKAWIVQADGEGTLTLLNARTGDDLATLSLGGKIQGSPAVYKDYLVIGTCSKGNSFMYGIRLE